MPGVPPSVLGHGTLLMSWTACTYPGGGRACTGNPGPPDPSVPPLIAVDLQGLLVLTLPRRLVLHGTQAVSTTDLAGSDARPRRIPSPVDGDSELLPFTRASSSCDEPTATPANFWFSAQAVSSPRHQPSFLTRMAPAAGRRMTASQPPSPLNLALATRARAIPPATRIYIEWQSLTPKLSVATRPAMNESLSTQRRRSVHASTSEPPR